MSAAIIPPIHRSQVRTVALDEITIDPKVQRKEGVDQRRVDRMAANFDADALGVFILSARPDGTLVCLDGMHRRAAAIAAGHSGRVDAIVFSGLTTADEASLFLLYNDKKDPSAISKFHARVQAGDPVAIDINRIVLANGWNVSQSSHPGQLSAIQAVERVYTNAAGALPDGQHTEMLDLVLNVITEAWGHDNDGANGTILLGLAQLFGRFGTDVDCKKLVSEFQQTRPKTLIGRAKTLRDAQGGTVPSAFAKVATGLHNKKKRTNLLPEWVWVR